ncbi:hypothetical protein ACHWQZ_G016647 [Mnemiopsis leidyi]
MVVKLKVLMHCPTIGGMFAFGLADLSDNVNKLKEARFLFAQESRNQIKMPVKPNYTYRCTACGKMWFSNSKWSTKLECTKCKVFVEPTKYDPVTDKVVAS